MRSMILRSREQTLHPRVRPSSLAPANSRRNVLDAAAAFGFVVLSARSPFGMFTDAERGRDHESVRTYDKARYRAASGCC